MKMNCVMLALVLGASASFSVPALAGGGGVAGATEITQLLNNMELLVQSATQAKHLETALKQAMTLGNVPWSKTAQNLLQLQQLVNKGYALGSTLSGLETKFSQRYGSYNQGAAFKAQYGEWSKTTRDSITGALKASGYQADQFQSEAGLVGQLRDMNNNAQGQLQATQAGAAVAVEMVGQLQQLRQLQIAQDQAHNAYMAGQQASQDADNSVAESFIKRQFRNIR